jgi:hypothetical protein
MKNNTNIVGAYAHNFTATYGPITQRNIGVYSRLEMVQKTLANTFFLF